MKDAIEGLEGILASLRGGKFNGAVVWGERRDSLVEFGGGWFGKDGRRMFEFLEGAPEILRRKSARSSRLGGRYRRLVEDEEEDYVAENIEELEEGVSADIVARVVRTERPREVRTLDGRKRRIVRLRIRDHTSQTHATLWGKKASLVERGKIKPGVVVRIRNPRVEGRHWRSVLHVGAGASIEVRPKDPRVRKLPPASEEIVSRGRGKHMFDEPGEEWEPAGGEATRVTFRDVAGMLDVKECVQEMIMYPLRYPRLHERYRVRAGGGVLLYGPPGCGKTLIARATAGELKASFFHIKLSDILNKWFGESEQRLSGLFDRAREDAPSVIFMDEVDALGISREFVAGEAMRSVVSQLLVELDGFREIGEVAVIGATNTPWAVDAALLRPGRFGRTIFVPPPDLETREELFRLYTRGKRRPVARLDFGRLAELTQGHSCADVAEICKRAVRRPLREACEAKGQRGKVKGRPAGMEDFEAVIASAKPSIAWWVEHVKGHALHEAVRKHFGELDEFVKGYEPEGRKEVGQYG